MPAEEIKILLKEHFKNKKNIIITISKIFFCRHLCMPVFIYEENPTISEAVCGDE